MDSYNIGIIVSLGLLLLCSAFFSASETAFSSLNKIKLKHLASGGSKRAAAALVIAENYDKFLSTVLIGNNIVNIAASALATMLFISFFGNGGVSIATLVTTVAVLLIGEITPKTIAKENPEQIALFATPLLRFLILILTPVNKLVTLWKRFIIKLFNVQKNQTITEAELLTYVSEVRKEGGINKREEDMIRRTIEFDEITAKDIFTPRVDIIAVNISDTPENIDKVFCETGYSRLPVYKDTIDNIIGVILLKDFHYAAINHFSVDSTTIENIMKPVVYITKSMKIYKILKLLQDKKSHMAVLLDEYGGTIGILTIEDIIEEIVGEIWDEHDEVIEKIEEIAPGVYKISGNAHIEELYGRLPDTGMEELLKSGHKTNTTISNWIIERFGFLPKEGDIFPYKNLQVKVSKIHGHRVMEITISVNYD